MAIGDRAVGVGAIAATRPAAGSAQTIAIGQATETDAAQAIAWSPKHRLIGQALETDEALAITVIGGASPVTRQEQPAGRPSKKKAPSKRKRKPVVVSIDGEDFVVSSEVDAAQLLKATREAAEQKAKEEASEVLRKRRFKAARGSRLNTSPVTLDMPEVTARSADDVQASQKWIRELIQQFTSAISTEYEAAARDAEIAVNMDRRRLEDDEDEVIINLLFTI